jgi:hypothetical protein
VIDGMGNKRGEVLLYKMQVIRSDAVVGACRSMSSSDVRSGARSICTCLMNQYIDHSTIDSNVSILNWARWLQSVVAGAVVTK